MNLIDVYTGVMILGLILFFVGLKLGNKEKNHDQ